MLQDNLRRFFYRMKVTSFDGQHTAELPESILRLITDVTISESSYSDTEATYPSLTLTLQETLYNPAPGAILDLRFDTEKGFTYVSKEEMESGLTRSKKDSKAQPQPVIFLFAGNNKIEIEWGLLHPKKVSRKREFTIQTFSVQGGGSGHGTVNITAMDGTLQGKKANIDKGISFVDPVRHNSLKQVLWYLCESIGHQLQFDGVRVNKLPPFADKFVANRTEAGGDTAAPDPAAPITMPKGMSVHEFIKDLANEYSSSYEYDTDVTSGYPLLVFTFREQRYKAVDNTFTYKSTDDVIINYKTDSVEGVFNPITGSSSTVDGGGLAGTIYSLPLVTKDNTTDKVANPSSPAAKSKMANTLQRNYVGQSITTPAKTSDAVQNEAESLYAKNKYMTSLALTTIGHPYYRPGLIQMDNIGRRYSKKYRMFTVQHKLSNSGYLCSWSGMSHYDTDAGVNADDAAKENTNTSLQLVNKKG